MKKTRNHGISKTGGLVSKTAAAVIALVLCTISATDAAADHFNHISEIAIPFLIIVFAICYAALALVPALMVHLLMRLAFKWRGAFTLTYLFTWIGGELGIGASVLFSKAFSRPGVYESYHYTVYPWLILGLSFIGGFLGHRIRRNKVRKPTA